MSKIISFRLDETEIARLTALGNDGESLGNTAKRILLSALGGDDGGGESSDRLTALENRVLALEQKLAGGENPQIDLKGNVDVDLLPVRAINAQITAKDNVDGGGDDITPKRKVADGGGGDLLPLRVKNDVDVDVDVDGDDGRGYFLPVETKNDDGDDEKCSTTLPIDSDLNAHSLYGHIDSPLYNYEVRETLADEKCSTDSEGKSISERLFIDQALLLPLEIIMSENDDKTISMKDVAKTLKVAPSTVFRWCQAGKLQEKAQDREKQLGQPMHNYLAEFKNGHWVIQINS